MVKEDQEESGKVRDDQGGPGGVRESQAPTRSCFLSYLSYCLTCLLLDVWVELDPPKGSSDDFQGQLPENLGPTSVSIW